MSLGGIESSLSLEKNKVLVSYVKGYGFNMALTWAQWLCRWLYRSPLTLGHSLADLVMLAYHNEVAILD